MTMATSANTLDSLKRERPEWASWLAVVDEILRETAAGRWDAAVPPGTPSRHAAVPMLAGAAVSLQASSIHRLVKRVIRAGRHGGTPKMKSLEAALNPDLDVLTVFTASLCQDAARLKDVADRAGADAEALQAVAALVPVPFLQACNRRWASLIPESWVEGYCPVCGSWPAFAEVRGIERNRYFRCGRCGGEWHARKLWCPYCSMTDHNELVALVPEHDEAHGALDACKRCLGYVKTFTRLQGCPSDRVIVEDLASVALDVAAMEEGFRRPTGSAYHLDATVTAESDGRGFFARNG
jgi:FdhE protein